MIAAIILFTLAPITTSALTQNDVVSWMSSKNGTTIHDGGSQCVAAFNSYLRIWGISNPISKYPVNYAYQIFNYNAPDGWQKISGSGNYQVGDIVIWNSSVGGGAGHVGMVYSTSGGTVKIFDQNYVAKNVCGIHNIAQTSAIRGVFRPPLNAGNNPTGYVDPLEKYVFNAEFYYHHYKDLRDSFGYNENALYNHWKTLGIAEGRCASPYFDVAYYLNNNTDLKKAFGDDYLAAYNHFKTYISCEYRKLSPVLDLQYYKENNSDLSTFNGMELLQHFVNFGVGEGRRGSLEFDPICYRRLYSDMTQHDIGYSYWHYACHGISEGRIGHDDTSPEIKNISISEVTDNGFRISCKVSDNIGVASVKFPTWTEDNNQDDLIWYEGTIENGVATCYISASEHNNETENYTVHIYLYDLNNNLSTHTINGISLTTEPIEVSSVEYNGNTYKVFSSCYNWEEAKEWCELQGGHLATVTDENEWNAVSDLLKEYNGIRCWLGAESTSGVWKWVTGEDFSYSNWGESQPDCENNAEFHLGTWGNDINKRFDCYYWNDYNYSNYRVEGFVCEFEGVKLGDVNQDGKITVADAIDIQKHIAGIIQFEGDIFTIADVDQSDKITVADAIMIQKHIANIVTIS